MKIFLALIAVVLLMRFSDGTNRPPKEPSNPTKLGAVETIFKKLH